MEVYDRRARAGFAVCTGARPEVLTEEQLRRVLHAVTHTRDVPVMAHPEEALGDMRGRGR